VSAIAGIVRFDGQPDAATDLQRLMRPLANLGPDRQASWHDGSVALGFLQMTMLPEDRFDRQPWRARDGNRFMVADVRLDNRDELGDTLGIDRPESAAMADSEMLLRAYERWDLGCMDRIVGDFAFAVWDTRDRRLVCARSHIDGPPLYYHSSRHFFAFASTPTALFALPDVPRVVEESRIALRLSLLPGHQPDTYYRDIFKLLPAHYAVIADRHVKAARYWQFDRGRRVRLRSDEEYAAALRERFDQAVRARVRSVHPVGVMLSAGCDSSAVAVTAARILAEREKELVAFTAAPREGYPPKAFGRSTDESGLAAKLAASLPNVRHQIVRPRGRALMDLLDRTNPLFGSPIPTPANYLWITELWDAARQSNVRVLLDGGVGNATISYGGIPRLAGLLRSGRWLALAHEARALMGRGYGPRHILRQTLGPFLPDAFLKWWSHRRTGTAGTLADYSAINPAFAVDMGVADMARSQGWDRTIRPTADGYWGRLHILGSDDRADYRNGSLAGWGIEQRDPTSDRRVVEFCLAIPEDQFLRDGETRGLFRRAFADRIPAAEIADRPRGYQGADWHEGLDAARYQIVAELGRMEKSPGARRALDLPRLRHLVEDWPTGNWHSPEVTQKYRLMLLRAVAVGKFIRWVEGGNE
jgi:asparagine synthase (glutamine-hydrolysing)